MLLFDETESFNLIAGLDLEEVDAGGVGGEVYGLGDGAGESRHAGAAGQPDGDVQAGSGDDVAERVFDRDRHRVTRDGAEIRLTPKEFGLLLLLAQHAGRVLTHRAILKALWGPHAVDQPEHLRVLVGSLRKKIEPNPARPIYVVTEPWVGYRFVGSLPPE